MYNVIVCTLGCVISNIFVSDQALPRIFLVPGFIEAHWHRSFFAAPKIQAARAQSISTFPVAPGVEVSILNTMRNVALTPAI